MPTNKEHGNNNSDKAKALLQDQIAFLHKHLLNVLINNGSLDCGSHESITDI